MALLETILKPETNEVDHCRQLPLAQKTIHESWTITYHHPHPRTTSHVRVLGVTLWRRFEREEGSILSVVPNTHFSQDELAATVALHESSAAAQALRQRKRRLSKVQPPPPADQQQQNAAMGLSGVLGVGGGGGWESAVHAAELETRIRGLDWKVQDEIYELLSDRVQSSSNAFRRREWRVVVMAAIPGGELTDSPTGFTAAAVGRVGKRRWFGRGSWRWKEIAGARTNWDPKMPVTEYRLILRGTETKANDHGWGYYNRYSRPWRMADEKEIGEKRRWSSMTGKSDKYVDF